MSESTAITILRLLTAKPPPRWKANKRAQLTDEQTRLLAVLSDEWLEQGVPGGQLLAERLPGPITDQRCVELGFEIWLGICSLHRLVLFLMPEPVFDEIALAGDEQLAFRLCAWLKVERAKSALHGLVAACVWKALREVEEEDLTIRSQPWSQRYPVGKLIIEFGRDGDLFGVTTLIDADGFEIPVENLTEGPLAALQEYRPPPARYELSESYGDDW